MGEDERRQRRETHEPVLYACIRVVCGMWQVLNSYSAFDLRLYRVVACVVVVIVYEPLS